MIWFQKSKIMFKFIKKFFQHLEQNVNYGLCLSDDDFSVGKEFHFLFYIQLIPPKDHMLFPYLAEGWE